MLTARVARPHSFPQFFSSSSSPFKPLLLRQPFKFNSISFRPHSSLTMSSQIVEHIVLFKVKPDTDPTKVNAMVNNLNNLTSLNLTLHLTAGPVLRSRSSSLSFTHMLHSRYKSKDDLAAYTVHPGHVSVVTDYVRPVIEDAMAVDWVSNELTGELAPKAGSAMRVTFLKLKEGLGEEDKARVLGTIGGIKDVIPSVDQVSFGENFSFGREKGYSIASIGVFSGLNELEAVDSNEELVSAQKEKVRDFLEGVVVVDYVVPAPAPVQAASL